MSGNLVNVNGIALHYLEHGGQQGPIVFLHGLSANAHSFDRVVAAGLSPRFRVLAPDLRGRGLSDKPPTGYSFADHAADILGWMDALELDQVILGGHSFGGFLASYLASQYPTRVAQLILLDISETAPRSPRVGELLQPSLGRLGRSWDTPAQFLQDMERAPFLCGRWNADLLSYYETDIEPTGEGGVRCRTLPQAVLEAARDGARLDWAAILTAVRQPTLLVHARDSYGAEGTTPLVTMEEAQQTASRLADGRCVSVPGNHMTMLFGREARDCAGAILDFLDRH